MGLRQLERDEPARPAPFRPGAVDMSDVPVTHLEAVNGGGAG